MTKDERLYYLIGVVCTQFSKLEFMLAILCSKLIGDDANIGAIITSECFFLAPNGASPVARVLQVCRFNFAERI